MSAYVPDKNTTDLAKFVRSLLGLASGRSNAIGTVTLAVSATSTTVIDPNCAAGSQISLSPQTADAAAALATTYVPPATVTNGAFVIQHVNNTQADRTFVYGIKG